MRNALWIVLPILGGLALFWVLFITQLILDTTD